MDASTSACINILHGSVEAKGLEWVMSKMLQAAGVAHQPSLFLLDPLLETSVSIHKTWLSLGLPLAGIAGLQRHYMCKLMLGPAVTFPRSKRSGTHSPMIRTSCAKWAWTSFAIISISATRPLSNLAYKISINSPLNAASSSRILRVRFPKPAK